MSKDPIERNDAAKDAEAWCTRQKDGSWRAEAWAQDGDLYIQIDAYGETMHEALYTLYSDLLNRSKDCVAKAMEATREQLLKEEKP